MIESALIYLALHLAAGIFGTQILWGFDSWRFLPIYIYCPLLIIGVACLVPVVNARLKTVFESAAGFLESVPKFIYPLIALAVFFIFRQSGFLLGDGLLRLRNLEDGIAFLPAEPLDMFLHSKLYDFLKGFTSVSGANVYQWLSILSGAAAVAGTIYYLKRIFSSSKERIFIGALIFTSGAVQLFFGYVENYSIAACLLLLFVLSAMAMMKGKKFGYLPFVYLSIAVALHLLSFIFLVPAVYLLYVSVIKWGNGRRKTLRIIIVALIFIMINAAAILLYYLAGLDPIMIYSYFGGESHFLGLFASKEAYGLFSMAHFIDIINYYALILPSIILLPVILFGIKKIKLDSITTFLLIAVLSTFLLLFFMKSELGFARDWDILAVAAFPSAILLGMLALQAKTEGRYKFAIPILVISCIHTASWIGVNANEQTALRRAEAMADTYYWSAAARARMYDELTQYYFPKNNSQKALEMVSKAYMLKPSERLLFSKGSLCQKLHLDDEAIACLSEIQKTGYNKQETLALLGDLYLNKKDYMNAEDVYIELSRADTNNREAFYNLGIIYKRRNDFKNAESSFLNVLRVKRDDVNSLNHLGEIYFKVREYERAKSVYLELMRINPENATNAYNLAVVSGLSGNWKEAMKYAVQADELGFDKKVIDNLKSEIKRYLK